jgi:NAD(P)-dependent dehydrogenase (short-subunit alcohol dehydrogenase family)
MIRGQTVTPRIWGDASRVQPGADVGLDVALLASLQRKVEPDTDNRDGLPAVPKKHFQIPADTLRATPPVRRQGEPEDIANACAFLVSEASGYVTGQTIGVNGGRVVS